MRFHKIFYLSALFVLVLIASHAIAKYRSKPLAVKDFRVVLASESRLKDMIAEMLEQRCCDALAAYGAGTQTIEEVNTACNENWDENSWLDQYQMILTQTICIANTINERDSTTGSIIDNIR